jgi:hypothetical protein
MYNHVDLIDPLSTIIGSHVQMQSAPDKLLFTSAVVGETNGIPTIGWSGGTGNGLGDVDSQQNPESQTRAGQMSLGMTV